MEKKIEEMAQDIAKVIDDVHAGCRLTECEDCRYFEYDLENCKAYAIAERLDALDYRKQVQGEWIRQDKELGKVKAEAKCSICGRDVVYQIIDNKWQFENYCPHCGAKMKGE